MPVNIRFITLIICCMIFGLFGGSASALAEGLDLTPDELNYVKEHPVVTLGVAKSFDPFVHRNEDGSYSGIDVDITDLITKMTGLEFHFELGKWAEIVKRAEQKEIDGLTSTIPHPSRAESFNFSIPYTQYSSVVLVKKNNPEDIHNIRDLEGKRAAVMTSNINMLNQVRNLGVDVDIVWEPNTYELVKSVATSRSDFTIAGETAFYIIAKLGMAGFIESAFPTGTTTEFCYSLRNDRPELVSIFNKALKNIPQQKIVAIRNKWLQGSAWNPVDRAGRIRLSEREQDFLSIHNSLGVGVSGDQPPFSFFSSSGKLEGIIADFMKHADDSLGSGVKLLPVRSSTPMKDLEDNKCDLVLMGEIHKNFDPKFSYTTPYVSFPYVVVARMSHLFQDEFKPEKGTLLAVMKGSEVIPNLIKTYPGIEIREFKSVKEGLKQVRDGQIFGLIATSPVATHEIQDGFLTELKIIGQTKLKAAYAVATRKSDPELNRIFQKIVGITGNAEIRKVINKWMAVKYEKGVDYALIWKIVAGSAILLSIILFWNRMLGQAKRRAERALEAEREAIKANLNFIDMISHEYRSPLSVISSNLDLLEAKTALDEKKDLSRELGRMRNSTQRLLNIFEKSLAKIRIESAGMLPAKQRVNIRHMIRAAVRDIRNAHPDHVVNIECPEDFSLITGDPELLNIAIINIIDNACKYSASDVPVVVSMSENDDKAIIRIRDHGVGIRNEELEHIFEKYYRSQNVGKKRGVGMGLYLVEKIIDLHGGKITVTSDFGEGTTFIVELPVN